MSVRPDTKEGLNDIEPSEITDFILGKCGSCPYCKDPTRTNIAKREMMALHGERGLTRLCPLCDHFFCPNAPAYRLNLP